MPSRRTRCSICFGRRAASPESVESFAAVATRLTYTTGARSAELDAAFEAALAAVRSDGAEPLPHLVGGEDVDAGDVFERHDPSRNGEVASRAREGGAPLVADAVA